MPAIAFSIATRSRVCLLTAVVLSAACGRTALLEARAQGGGSGQTSDPGGIGGTGGSETSAGASGGAAAGTSGEGEPVLGDPWPMFGRDPQGTRRSRADTSTNTGALRWSYDTGSPVRSSPVIGEDGTVYVVSGDNTASRDFTLHAIGGTTGVLKWSYAFSESSDMPPVGSPGLALAPDATVYVGADKLYAIHAPSTGTTGVLAWSFQNLIGPGAKKYPEPLGAPTIGKDGTLYVPGSSSIYVITAPSTGTTGVPVWSYYTGGGRLDPLAIGVDGAVYTNCASGALCVISPPAGGGNGALKWSFKVAEGDVGSSPAVGVDGTVYVGWGDGRLYAISPPVSGTSGVLKWSFYTYNIPGISAPALGADGTVYLGTSGGDLFAIGPPVSGTSGVLKWRYPAAGTSSATLLPGVLAPALAADGTVYAASSDGSLRAISPPGSGTTGVLKWSFKAGGRVQAAPSIGADGTVYVGSDDGRVYAIH